LGEINYFYEDYGNGTPIIFIHPPAMGRKVFYYQKELSQNARVIFPDLSGHGDTHGVYEEVSISTYALEIQAIMDGLHIDKAFLCGYSAGSAIAQEFALNYPDRTLGIILTGGYPAVEPLAFKYEHLIGMYLVKHFPGVLRKIISSSHTEEAWLRNVIFHHMEKANRRSWFQFYQSSLNFSCVNRLHRLHTPLLLIYGSKDWVNQHLRTYRRYTEFQLTCIQNVSHQIPTKKWKLYNQAILGFVQTQQI
jgi:pimeloyl-ACP methyl ester carboxylesterase